jgi:hypothetical protein
MIQMGETVRDGGRVYKVTRLLTPEQVPAATAAMLKNGIAFKASLATKTGRTGFAWVMADGRLVITPTN